MSTHGVHVVCVAGARPNFMKIAPVRAALIAAGAEVTLVHTGQHYDPALSDIFFDELGLPSPDHHLGVGSGSHAEQTAGVMIGFERVLADDGADVVVVVGDVNSTLACALVTAKHGAQLAHVEAGLRSRDWSMPEEINRVATDAVSDHLLAPSKDAVANLEAEGFRDNQIHFVGNVMVDCLLANLERASEVKAAERYGLQPGGYGLVTLHRPSNVDDPAVLEGVLGALGRVARELPLLFPAHPRTAERLNGLEIPPGVRLVEPTGYLDTISLQADAAVVLTDSGGMQEETTVLGVPCLTLRDTTERPITVSEGTNRVVGSSADDIVAAAAEALKNERSPRRPELWDGRAAERVAAILMAAAGDPVRRRPTPR